MIMTWLLSNTTYCKSTHWKLGKIRAPMGLEPTTLRESITDTLTTELLETLWWVRVKVGIWIKLHHAATESNSDWQHSLPLFCMNDAANQPPKWANERHWLIQLHDFFRAYSLFVSLVASLAPTLRSGTNQANGTANKLHALQKSCHCSICLTAGNKWDDKYLNISDSLCWIMLCFIGVLFPLCLAASLNGAFRKNCLVFEFPIHRLPFLRVDTRSVETSLRWGCVRCVT